MEHARGTLLSRFIGRWTGVSTLLTHRPPSASGEWMRWLDISPGDGFHGHMMEEQPPPFTPQEISALQAAQYAGLGQPQTVKVFGIMHVVFAAFGLLSSVWVVFDSVAGNSFINRGPQTPEMAAQAKAAAAMEQGMMPMTVISTVLTVIVGLLMLKAGILLLKKRRGGLLWSNRYAWSSLASKVVNVALTFIYVMPAANQMFASMPRGAASMPGGMEWIVIGSMLFGLVITAVYPILTLVLLNSPKTKEWFTHQPE